MVSNNRNDNETKNLDAGDWGFFVDIDIENQNENNLDNKKMLEKYNMTNKKLNSPFEDILEEYEYYSYQQNKLVDLEENKMNHENYIYKANTELKTNEFKEQHKYALFKILTTYHKKYLENGSKLKLPETTIARTQQYLESNSILTNWFQNEYEQDLPDSNPTNIKIIDLLDHFKNSETFENLSKQDKNKYGRNTFIEYIRNNLFFKKYYHERHDRLKNIIKGWHLKTEDVRM
jgi:hypothetical protein